jgi:ATP-dependent DNA helicase RecQ
MELVTTTSPALLGADIAGSIAKHWGIRSLRPLQQPAIQAVLEGRDSLVVLPTGGGKSLCYQAPAVVQKGVTVVVSPLISLMKDQVDGLRESGVAAIRLDSSLSPSERMSAERELRCGKISLLFVSPERLMMGDFMMLLQEVGVNAIAIDEAHCISQWGHDFRPEYRQLKRLRELFPRASLHAYTATATERVRKDILEQLGLKNPEVLVGNFDRPNLTYRIVPRRGDLLSQVLDVLARHKGEGGIIYCISRNDVNTLSQQLNKAGLKAMPYHAGLTPMERTKTQDAFLEESCDVVVATVAFGMGIDRSNVRFVLHTGMPKSLEAYQQETGRAGRDGLGAECVLLSSGQDFFTWKGLMERAARENQSEVSHLESSIQHLNEMWRYCRSSVCRHRALVNYFGQEYKEESCNACDHCLGETIMVEDADVIAQKIVSCVARVRGSYGIGYFVSVLRGEKIAKIKERGHDQISTFGLLKEHDTFNIRDWVYQLIGHGVLTHVEIETGFGKPMPVVKLNQQSMEVLRGERKLRLLQPVRAKKGVKGTAPAGRREDAGWDGVDRDLFDELRSLRKTIADEIGMPPYIVFHDATLREFARSRPSTLEQMRGISGVGDAKLRNFGEKFRECIAEYGRKS